ncbi:CDP-diacylglycerol--serine O-phosphatidyltransferase [Nitrincola sp. A-D6]|uniref:CDP-diacylglycerol--serine O-phosphatidyltransferase n=1 Tax=Nitrincola sp. A-D6 TaxID=1545442 RepID=UPI00051FCB5C|nr:CDP-diacylglycerol--serine O-phosphatidyltransferase [Nitrincola sp. A-D6]KGK41957.1 CDP-diacylglycerol--serine O-phosphatidyltransferase [Nitrincola sp. A-D6]
MIDKKSHDTESEEQSAGTPEVDRVKPHKGVYLLPNLFTTGALFSGFYAVIASMNGQFEAAAIAIFVSMLFDGLDGRVARMTNTQSPFGAEYDSLADMVSFGVAPAIVAFTWALDDLGKLGWFAAFLYVAGTALRLARFNTQIGSVDKRYFVGLPSPAAAAAVAGLIWMCTKFEFAAEDIAYLVALYVALAGVLMVSNILYYSFKDVDLKDKVPFLILSAIVLGIAVISISPALFLWLLFVVYAFSGPVLWLVRKKKHLVK